MQDAISLPKSLRQRLEKVSRVARKDPQTIVREAVADRLAYLEWEAAAIAEGQADLDAGRVMTTQQLRQALTAQRARRAKKGG